jgi:hypothetical protein
MLRDMPGSASKFTVNLAPNPIEQQSLKKESRPV